MKVGIVGAGVAGLAAARVLRDLGHEVVIFEGREEVGGQVVTFPVGGEELECFYHHIFTSDTTVIRYIEELGLGQYLRWIEPRNAHFVRGRMYPFVTPLDLLRFTAIPLTSRIRLGLAALWLRRRADGVRRYEGVTARDWMLRAVGQKAFDAFWGPLLKGKFADQADQVGMVWLWNKIYLRFASRKGGSSKEVLGYLEGSFKRYYRALADRLEGQGVAIRLRTPVETVVSEGGRVTGLRAAGTFHPFDAVLLTVPNVIALKIAPDLPAAYRAVLERVRYQWATCLVLALDRPLTPYYWLSIGDDLPFVACIEHTNFMPPERYGGNHVVYLSNYTAPDHPVLQMDADAVFAHYLDGIRRLNPAFDPSWVREKWFFKDPGGQPVITTFYSRSIPDMRTGIEGLYLSNTTQVYPEDRGQNYSLLLGEKAGRLIHDDSVRTEPGRASQFQSG
ncbi:MAG: NAD(P)/FAD-dependent oxidoreductase [Dehalococcoidia bacterium]|nr:NAD(P)/FAD-dependent oxidoreductase [Dehalococcoidia bacterium]